MRLIVGALRKDHRAHRDFRPRPADWSHLATAEGAPGLRVEVEHTGDLDDLSPSVQAALHRLAQEAVTNAQRHANRATTVQVVLIGEPETVRLTVSDDGRAATTSRSSGYGLVGMAERVGLLGGTLEAGPSGSAGWTVRATIPRHGSMS